MSALISHPRITVVIPVYNIEQYVAECLQSVVDQTFTDLEIIVVDDGSTDRSASIVDAFALRDKRIRVVHQENRGLSAARNLAISMATCPLIAFVDGDDKIDRQMMDKLHTALTDNNADVAICNYLRAYRNERCPCSMKIGAGNYDRLQSMYNLLCGNIHTLLCNKLFRREVLTCPLPEGKVFEDLDTLYKWFASVRKVTVICDVLYFYRMRKGGITGSRETAEKVFDSYTAHKGRLECAIEQGFVRPDDVGLGKYVVDVATHIAQSRSGIRDKRRYLARLRSEPFFRNSYPIKDLGADYVLRKFLIRLCPTLLSLCQGYVGRKKYKELIREKQHFD